MRRKLATAKMATNLTVDIGSLRDSTKLDFLATRRNCLKKRLAFDGTLHSR